jgi:hypothetical protein
MRLRLERVEEDRPRLDSMADPRVGGEALELLHVSSREQEVIPPPPELQRDRPRNRRGRAENDDRPSSSLSRRERAGVRGPHPAIPNRRACDDDSFPSGSSRAFTA